MYNSNIEKYFIKEKNADKRRWKEVVEILVLGIDFLKLTCYKLEYAKNFIWKNKNNIIYAGERKNRNVYF